MNQLPTLADLHKDPQEAFKNDQFKLLLNQPPHASWVKKHPMAKAKNDQGQTVPAEYMPIDKVEFLLDYIFQQWKVEVLSVQALFNSITVTVRLHFLNPVTGEWAYHDGIGAAAVQVDKGMQAGDLSAIKSSAVQMAAPSAKSYAIKDAAEHLGKLFGRDLNRKDAIMFVGAYSQEAAPAPQVQQAPQPAFQAAPQPQQAAPQPHPAFQAAPPQGAQQSFFFNPANL